jgi:hypothetical protein
MGMEGAGKGQCGAEYNDCTVRGGLSKPITLTLAFALAARALPCPHCIPSPGYWPAYDLPRSTHWLLVCIGIVAGVAMVAVENTSHNLARSG